MTTHGPFYPASVSGSGWTHPENAAGPPNHQSATVTIPSDSASPPLVATDYGVCLPEGATIVALRFGLQRTFPAGLNESVYALVPRGDDLSDQGDGVFALDNTEADEPLTAADVSDPAFGWQWAAANLGTPASASVKAMPLWIDTEE